MTSPVLPHHVALVIETLKQNDTVNEIWLIGSRVNGTAHAQSDWDILVKATSDPSMRIKEHSDIDVVWCGPSGWCLAGGAPECFRFQFADFEWSEVEGKASYLGRKFTDVEYGVVRDASQPVQVRTRQTAFRVWISRGQNEQQRITRASTLRPGLRGFAAPAGPRVKLGVERPLCCSAAPHSRLV